MGIDFQIPLHLYGQVKEPVSGKTVQHMVKESDAGLDIGFPAPIQVKAYLDFCFFCIP